MAWLITGGSGYLGSNLAKRLISENIEFHILDLVKPGFEFTSSDNSKFTEIDIRSPISAFTFLDAAQFEGVIHLAALKDAVSSSNLGAEYWSVNVAGTQNILDLASYLQIPRMLFISSAAVYGNVTSGNSNISELTPCLPVNNYGRTKLAAEYLLQTEANSSEIKITSFRLFNLVGGIAPAFIPGAVQGFPKLLYSSHKEHKLVNLYRASTKTDDETCVRDYVNVEDVIEAIFCWMVNPHDESHFDVFNVASGRGLSTLQVVHEFEKQLQEKVDTKLISARSEEAALSIADISKIRNHFEWEPRKTFADSVSEVISQPLANE
jgi:UDP-glucose 4-epimerase